MKSKKLTITFVSLLFLVSMGFTLSKTGIATNLKTWIGLYVQTTLNNDILSVIEEYPTDGTYQVLPQSLINDSSGTTQDLFYQGRRVAEGDSEKRSYCVGLIFEIYMKACEKAGGENFQLKGISRTNFSMLRDDFYGTDGNKKTFVDALSSRGLGMEVIDPNNAKQGDLVQFWRGHNGHAVVFLNWERNDNDKITGLHYWSIQSSTGIEEKTEYIKRQDFGTIDPEQIYIVRAYDP